MESTHNPTCFSAQRTNALIRSLNVLRNFIWAPPRSISLLLLFSLVSSASMRRRRKLKLFPSVVRLSQQRFLDRICASHCSGKCLHSSFLATACELTRHIQKECDLIGVFSPKLTFQVSKAVRSPAANPALECIVRKVNGRSLSTVINADGNLDISTAMDLMSTHRDSDQQRERQQPLSASLPLLGNEPFAWFLPAKSHPPVFPVTSPGMFFFSKLSQASINRSPQDAGKPAPESAGPMAMSQTLRSRISR